MNARQTKLLVLVVMLLLTVAGAMAAGDFRGVWVGKTEVPEQGEDRITLTLEKTASGYAGTITDSLGLIAPGARIKEVTAGTDTLRYSFDLVNGIVVVVETKVSGDTMEGRWSHEQGEMGAFVLERRK